MKPRHAAALALVSWYLMVPTFTKSQTGSSVGAMKRLTFDSCTKCADYRHNLIDTLMLSGFPRAALAVSNCTYPDPAQLQQLRIRESGIGDLVPFDSWLNSYWWGKMSQFKLRHSRFQIQTLKPELRQCRIPEPK